MELSLSRPVSFSNFCPSDSLLHPTGGYLNEHLVSAVAVWVQLTTGTKINQQHSTQAAKMR